MIFKRASFKNAKAIWIKNDKGQMNRSVIFESHIPFGEDTVLHITAQNSYQLFINDEFVFSGPARASHDFFRVDRLPIGKYLKDGENKLCVLVFGYRCNNFYLVNTEPFFCAELTRGESVFAATGTSAWKAYIYGEKLQKVQRYAFQRTFTEVYDFSEVEPRCVTGKKPEETEILSVDNFIEREVSYPKLPFEAYSKYIGAGAVIKEHSGKHFSPWWYDKVGNGYSGYLPCDIEFSSTELVEGITLCPDSRVPSGKLDSDSYSVAEMRCNMTGFVCLDVKCDTDTTLCLTFDEILSDGAVDFARMECANIIVYKLRGGKSYRLISAEPYTFKYMNVISLGGAVDVSCLGVIRTDFNEDEIIKKLKSGADEQIKRIYDAGIETFRQNTYDIFMDCPSRERAGWLCDSFFTSRVEYLLSGKSVVEKSFLANFVMNGQYPLVPSGMLPMCYPADHADGNFIPNWAMWYVLELREYLSRTKDSEFVKHLKDKLYSLLEYFRGFENKDGILEKLKGWIFVEWSECNNLCQDINYPTNMLYYMFKTAIAELYSDSSLLAEAELLRKAIRRDARMGLFFCDNAVRDESGKYALSGKRTETCQYYAFFTGVATPEEDSELWQVMLSDFGPQRKRTGKWSDIYFSNAFIGNYLRCDLLKRSGLKDELERDIRDYFDYMAIKTGTLWEYDSTCASCNHGFASHVLIWLDYLGYIENKTENE